MECDMQEKADSSIKYIHWKGETTYLKERKKSV